MRSRRCWTLGVACAGGVELLGLVEEGRHAIHPGAVVAGLVGIEPDDLGALNGESALGGVGAGGAVGDGEG